MQKKLTIVVDMLNGFAKFGPLSSPLIKNIIPNIKSVLNKAENIIFLADAHSEDDLEMKSYPPHCLKGTPEAEIVEELIDFVEEDNKNVIYKNTTNGFFEIRPDYWDRFNSFEIVGCCTDICILQLALSLKMWLNKINSDKEVVVIENSVATFDSENHNAKEFHQNALNIMKNANIVIK
ncbi:cysteine hydrolase [Mycoplasma sp. CSL7491-lung]|uniref:isochorismatase family cysteine hydrolase n=1 Tax=Mycoplasma sp. CSL7491-lung TaxID=549718 RepID=UPI001C114F6F|nr:isochorismatase family cysteine hydrolase [Mycoplasma sp. CSL7491-lung]MBU4692715.1 cysteine hydrolase [Mycoplasma sp. CSL7491-lung]